MTERPDESEAGTTLQASSAVSGSRADDTDSADVGGTVVPLRVTHEHADQVVTVADACVEIWRRAGASRVFGIPGAYLTLVLDSLSRAKIPMVRSLHEGAAAFASAGYTLAGQDVGVVVGQSGPGVTNLVTGVAAAYSDCVPMLVVATQAPLSHYARDSHQETRGTALDISQAGLLAQCASVVYRPPNPDATLRSMRLALSRAIAERSTTAVELSVDLTSQYVDFSERDNSGFTAYNHAVDQSAVEYVAKALATAERPLLVLGDRIAHRQCSRILASICERHQIPCVVIGHAKGIVPEDHPYYAGVLEQSGHRSAFELACAADLTVTLGLRTTIQATLGYSKSLFKRLIQIDEDSKSIGRAYPVELGAVSNLPEFVEALAAALGDSPAMRRPAPNSPPFMDLSALADGKFSTPVALAVLRKELPRDCLVVGDSGLNLQYLKYCFPVYEEDGFFCLYSLAAMGAALPVAIGVALARQPQTVINVIGDDGILVYPAELSVAAQLQLPVITVVINNRGYRQVGDRLANYCDTTYGGDLPPVDVVAMAESYGAMGRRASDPQELAQAVRSALQHKGPSLIEACVQGDSLYQVTPPEVRAWQDKVLTREPRVMPWPFESSAEDLPVPKP